MTLWVLIYLCAGHCHAAGQLLIVHISEDNCETASLEYGMPVTTTKDDPDDRFKICDWTCPPSRQIPVPPYVTYTICKRVSLYEPPTGSAIFVGSQSKPEAKPE